MKRKIPEKLIIFLKTAVKDVDDGYEYSSELNRILNSDECQASLSPKEIEKLKEFSERVKKVGEINYYSEEKIKDIEKEIFGSQGIAGYLGISEVTKPVWPF
ncbi:MAG: hypothetical protein GX660_07610 [Clostridiaceae bacterium]|nr:hypothetical protein [Clostridiaceae bacterium]